jgi:hypothetical protein
MDIKEMKSRGQVTIFVIVSLIIIATIILLFIIRGSEIELPFRDDFNPEGIIDQCLRESVRSKIEIMAPQGGFENPTDFKIYNDIKVTYLCKNVNYYDPCVMQYPMYLSVLNQEIKENVEEEIEECFVSLEEELISRNYDYSGSDIKDIAVALKPGSVELAVFREFSYTTRDVSKSHEAFRIELKTKLFDLAKVAQRIMDDEARTCDFDLVNFMRLNPEIDIRKWVMSDSTEIYTIIDRDSGLTMNVAERGCAFPAGL